MLSVSVSSQLLFSVLFIAIPENFKIFPTLVCVLFLVMQSYNLRTIENMIFLFAWAAQ